MPSAWLARLDPRAITILIYFGLILYLLRPNVLHGQSRRVIRLLRWFLILSAFGELIIKFGDLALPLSATASLLVGRGLTLIGFFFAFLGLAEIARTPAPRWLRYALLCPGAAIGLGLSTLWLNDVVSAGTLAAALEFARTAMILFEGVLFALFVLLFYRLTRRETAALGKTRFGLFFIAALWGEVVIVLYFVRLFALSVGQTGLAEVLDDVAFWFDVLSTLALIAGLVPTRLLRGMIEVGAYLDNQLAILELRNLITALEPYAPKFHWPTPTFLEGLRAPYLARYALTTRVLDQIHFLGNRPDVPTWLQWRDLDGAEQDQLVSELRALSRRCLRAQLANLVSFRRGVMSHPLQNDLDPKN